MNGLIIRNSEINLFMATKGSKIPKDLLELYKKLVASDLQSELKGDKVPYTSLNGHMFSYINEGSLVLRLSKNEKEAFEKKYKTGPVISYGVIKTEFVCVPEELLNNTKELKKYFDLSKSYTQTLKPKPGKMR